MPGKRKASSGVRGGTKSSKDSKAATPGLATPRSIGSSDEFSSEGASETEEEDLDNAIHKFTLGYQHKRDGPSGKDSASHHFGNNDFSYLSLKPDHDLRPLWIDPVKARIILESFSPLAVTAQDFLITVAEPLSRPSFLHEYVMTAHSLYAAVSVGLDPKDIMNVLERLSKTPVSENIKSFIVNCTKEYGKVKLVLKNTKHFIESSDPEMLQRLLKDEVIGKLRVQGSGDITTSAAPKMGGLVIPGTKDAAGMQQAGGQVDASKRLQEDEKPAEVDIYATLNEDDDDDEVEAVHSFEVAADGVEDVQKRCLAMALPITEEYDFRNDTVNANLDIDLKPSATIRSYQEKSLSKMFGNGRAKSGIIVLPCGAGKTLVGITAACTIKKGVIILCTSAMSVNQWRNEFLKWSNVNPNDIAIFTSDSKEKFQRNTGIIVSTYAMVSQTRARAHDSAKMMEFLQTREWGLMILDEVHVVPANVFRKVMTNIKTHSKLGLTATLLREDNKIDDLNFLIGPKLYEANWMELADQGHIARVQCAEVWCPMTTEFYSEYMKASEREGQLLYAMNPTKFQAAQFLVDYHEKRGDKIIVFSDNLYALKSYAEKLGKVYIFGGTSQAERVRILENFQLNDNINTLFLSKIGDTSLDLPEATVLIQISSHYGSRRQEAQRLGRILRAKRRNDEGFSAFFYSLVSKDTREMYYSAKRQAFLVDQGYAFKVITHLQGMQSLAGLAFNTASERRELLQRVMIELANKNPEEEIITDDLFHINDGKTRGSGVKSSRGRVRRTAGQLSELAGGQDMAYVEMNRSMNKELKKGNRGKGGKKESNPFFKKLQREQAKRRAVREEGDQ